MRKSVLFFASTAIFAVLLCCSCQKERFVEGVESVDSSSAEGVVKTISLSVEPFEIEHETIETKSTYDSNSNFYFAATDTVGVFPSKGSQVYFGIEGEDIGKQTVRFDGGGWALKEGFSYWSYSPLVGDFYLKKDHIPVEYFDLTQDGNEAINQISPVDYIFTDKCSVENGSLSFVYHHLNCILRPKVTLPAGSYSKIVIQAESNVFVTKGYYDLTASKPSVIGTEFTDHLTLNLKNVSFTEETAFVGNLMAAPVDISNMPIKVIIYSGDSPMYYYTYERSTTLKAGGLSSLVCSDLKSFSTVYTKASSITVGGTYLIVDKDDSKLFNGGTAGKFENVSPRNNVITDNDGSFAGYEFTVEKNGNNYYLKFNDGKYLVCDYSNNSSAGLAYVNTQSDVKYPYTLTTGDNGAFFFSTTQVNATSETNQVLYYKSDGNVFKIGGSGNGKGVHLYMRDGKQDRGLSFNPGSVTCTLGDVPEKPVLSGTYTAVTYSSSDPGIARVDADGKVTPVAAGTVTITASVAEDEQYSAGSASYSLRIRNASSSGTYVRVTSADQIGLEQDYIIVYDDGSTPKAFKPILNAGKDAFLTTGNAVDVEIFDDEIDADKVDDCRFMLANQEGNKFAFLVPEADGTTDYYLIVYYNVTRTNFYASPTENSYRATFSLSPDGKLSLVRDSYNFRYSSGSFSASTSASSNLYLFVRSGGQAKQKQTLSFTDPTVTWSVGNGHEIDGTYAPQSVGGAQTTVTYTAEPESVAKIENGKIKIIGAGSATITATAEKTDKYYGATASYTLRIIKTSDGWIDLGSFSLENAALAAYLDDASRSYTDTDEATNTVMPTYLSGIYANMSRKDCPAPVNITWSNAASRNTVVSIFENDSLENPVWTQNASDGATSADVYNLIPGRTYYYTVSEDGTIWEKGYFSTTGRRRMMKVSDTKGKARANNCRDLGGLEVMDNGTKKTIRYGLIYRGSCLDATTSDEKDFMVGFMNIGLDVDLRDGNSNTPGQGNDGNSVCYQAFGANYDVAYNSQKFASGRTIEDLTTPAKVKNVLTDIFNTLLQPSGKSVYLHCHIGADRTGYIAMLIEGLLGVSEKDCSIDYELTSFSDAAGKRYRNGQPEWYTFVTGIDYLRNLPGTTFQNKIETYLVNTVGIDKTQIDDFKSFILVEN